MRWRGRQQSSNIQDVRGRSGGGVARGNRIRLPGGFGRQSRRSRMPRMGRGATRSSGGGFKTIILLIGLFLILKMCGLNPLDMLAENGGYTDGDIMPRSERITRTDPAPTSTRERSSSNDSRITSDAEMKEFVGVVLAETESVWNGIFKQAGKRYPEPKLVMFSRSIRSACGLASSASGPFYCPADSKVYLDTDFFRTLERQFGAHGDFAKAYVIAHEIGHHVQNVVGVLPKFNRMRRAMRQLKTNQMSTRVELQADCYAGVWAHYTEKKGLLHKGDLEEALNAAMQIGDDAIQRRTQGYVVPESFNHGTSKQRRAWFYRGFETGKISQCDTKIFSK